VFAPRAGRPLVAVGIIILVIAVLITVGVLPHPLVTIVAMSVGTAVWLFLAGFFRDPERTPGDGIVSAADGRIREVVREGDLWRVSVFMNVTDVHVNRLPLDATVEAVGDAGHGFRPAYRPDANHNVQRSYRLSTAVGPVEVVQITGVVARRLVTFVRAGWSGRKGERFGMIVLGSRVDVLWPALRAQPVVKVGDRVRAGQTTIAREGG
jgi:phosphatidylserine decarboxylase